MLKKFTFSYIYTTTFIVFQNISNSLSFYCKKDRKISDTEQSTIPSIQLEEEPPRQEPINGIVQPPIIPPSNRPGRLTNQLRFIQKSVIKPLWKHSFAWPFQQPIDTIKLNLPVSDYFGYPRVVVDKHFFLFVNLYSGLSQNYKISNGPKNNQGPALEQILLERQRMYV